MNFQQLKFVRETVRSNLNLTNAASTLFTSQSGVSKRIRELELELGIEIFIRKGKRLVGLTKAGKGAAELIERVLIEADNLRRYSEHYGDKNKGRLVIATTHNQARYTLPSVAQRFSEQYPEVQIELRQGNPEYVAKSVLSGDAEIAIASESLDEHPELKTFPCFTWRHVVVAPNDHALTKIQNVKLNDLAQYSIITYSSEYSGRLKINSAFADAGLSPDIRLSAIDADVIKTHVELGMGIGIVPEMATMPEMGGQLLVIESSRLLFKPNTTKIAFLKQIFMPSYAYKFVQIFARRSEDIRPEVAVSRREASRESPNNYQSISDFSSWRDLNATNNMLRAAE